MTTAEAIRRLQRANPVPDGLDPPPLAPVLARLDEAPGRGLRPAQIRRRHRSGVVLPVLGSIVAVAVVAAAIALLGHRGSAPPPVGSELGGGSLTSQFGVLRRPQRPRDRDLSAWLRQALTKPSIGPIAPGLTRIVRTLSGPGRDKTMLVIVVHAHPQRLWLLTVTGQQRSGGGGFSGSIYTPRELYPQWGNGRYAASLVPDAVSRVRWVFDVRRPTGATVQERLSARITENVAYAQTPRNATQLASVTWYDSGGRTVAYEDLAMQQRRATLSTERADERAVSPILWRDFPILHRPWTASDQLPGPFLPDVGHSPRRYGLAPYIARHVNIPGTRLEEWIEPGRSGYCRFVAERLPTGKVQTGGFGGDCVPVSAGPAASIGIGGGAFLAPGPPLRATPGGGGPSLVTAAFPDTVSSVQLVHADGTTLGVPLTDGFIATRITTTDRLYIVMAGSRTLVIDRGLRLRTRR